MRADAARALVILALAGGGGVVLPAAPATAQAREPEARFETETLTLQLLPPVGQRPAVIELEDPPRIVAEWNGTATTAPRALLYGAGPVARFAVEIVGSRTRVTLTLRAKLDGGWNLGRVGAKTLVRLLPNDAESAYIRPLPTRTPRPAPRIVGLRVTPAPVYPLAPTPRPLPDWPLERLLPADGSPGPTDRHLVPDPFPYNEPSAPPATPALVEEQPSPTPTPAPSEEPTDMPDPEATPRPSDSLLGARAAFGSQVWIGAEPPVILTETYPVGGADISVPFGLGGGFGWDHMFTQQVGLSLAAQTQGYQIDDEAVRAKGFEIKHKRDDYEVGGGVRLRQPFGGGFEGMLQPGVLLRGSRATTTNAQLTDGVAGPAVDVPTTDYLTSSWLAYGGSVRGGLGWHAEGPFGLTTFGEYRYLASGSVMTANVPAFFPLSGWRAGGEARLDFDGWGLSAGFVYGMDGYSGTLATDTFSRAGGTATLRASWLY
jgi:hypothetical protein